MNPSPDRVLITGTARGIGRATALLFLRYGWEVYGLDLLEADGDLTGNPRYHHYVCDVTRPEAYPPDIPPIHVLVNNAAVITEERAMAVNAEACIAVSEHYAVASPVLRAVVTVGSIAGRVGLDRPAYAASMGARTSYTKNLAIRLGHDRRARANVVAFGAVLTSLEPELYGRPDLMEAVAAENILHRWATPEEAARWIFFLGAVDTACTGQEILVDNGEECNYNWIHP